MQIMCLDLWVAFFQPSNDDEGGDNTAKMDDFIFSLTEQPVWHFENVKKKEKNCVSATNANKNHLILDKSGATLAYSVKCYRLKQQFYTRLTSSILYGPYKYIGAFCINDTELFIEIFGA